MELRINLATCSLKDAEHAIFLIGAYHGMTSLPTVGGRTEVSTVGNVQHVVHEGYPSPTAAAAHSAAIAAMGARTGHLIDGGELHRDQVEQPDPATVFGGAGNAQDPAAVFGATVQGTPPLPATGGPSAPPAAAPAVGEAGNGAPTVGAPVGSSPSPAPAVGASAPPVDVDAAGLPWDSRIHASSEGGGKPKNADGKWRKKRGLNDEAFVRGVEAELRQTMAVPTPAAQVPTPPPPAGLPVPPVAQVPTPPAAGPQPAPTTFEALMPRITAAVMDGRLPQPALLQAVTAYQLPSIPSLASRPDMVPTIWAYLQSMYPALA